MTGATSSQFAKPYGRYRNTSKDEAQGSGTRSLLQQNEDSIVSS